MPRDKIKTWAELTGIILDAKNTGRIVGFTNGCFDILHAGHVRYLKEARNKCDILIVGVNSDSSVRALKGKTRPVNPEIARTEVLAALECVDLLTVFNEDTPENLIKMLVPDILFKGGDWKEDSVVGAHHVKEKGGKVVIIPYIEGYSTTDIIERMKSE